MPWWLIRLYDTVCLLIHEWTGDAEYERHIADCAERGQVPLDRGRYFACRMEQRYRGTARCC